MTRKSSIIVSENALVLGVMLFCITGLVVPSVGQEANNDNVVFFTTPGQAKVMTEDIVVKIVGGGNVPQYFFWVNEEGITNSSSTSPSTTQISKDDTKGSEKSYFVKFQKMFEFEDKNGNGAYDSKDKKVTSSQMTFPSTNWEFTEYEIERNTAEEVVGVHFNFTHQGSPTITFSNHVSSSKASELKFDILIQDYEWTGSTNHLAVEIIISGGELKNSTGQMYTFGEGLFEYEPTAESLDGQIKVGSSVSGNNILYLSYENFGSHLYHDPTIGISDSHSIGYDLNIVPVAFLSLSIATIIVNRKK